jgi:hypothetical protein
MAVLLIVCVDMLLHLLHEREDRKRAKKIAAAAEDAAKYAARVATYFTESQNIEQRLGDRIEKVEERVGVLEERAGIAPPGSQALSVRWPER